MKFIWYEIWNEYEIHSVTEEIFPPCFYFNFLFFVSLFLSFFVLVRREDLKVSINISLMLALTSASALSSINWLRLLTGCRSFSRYVSHVLDGIYSNLCILLPIDLGAPAPAWDSYFRIIYFEFYWFYYLLNLTLHSTTDKSSRLQGSVLSKILFFILKILYSQKCSQLVVLFCDHHDDSKLIFVMKYWDKWKYLF